MPPQKTSIKDFFAPAQKNALAGQSSAPKQPEPKSTPAFRRQTPASSKEPQNTASAQSTSPPSSPQGSPTIGGTIHVNTSRTTTTDNRPPSTSQSSADSAATSKRTVSNGEQVVLNSDSETDSLPDLDWGTPTIKTKHNIQSTKSKPEEETKGNELRRPPKKRKDEKSFTLFVQAAQKNAESERLIAEVKATLEKPLAEQTPELGIDIDEEALANAVHDNEDPEKAKRLYQAVQRTNALHTEYAFYLFNGIKNVDPVSASPFPMDSLPNHRWTSNFEEQSTRDQAFMSGFAQQVFRYQQLPEELASWIIDQVCICRSHALNEKYLQLLATHHHHLQTLLDEPRLNSIFYKLGADRQRLDPLQELTPSHEPQTAVGRPLPSSLEWVCRLLQAASPWLRTRSSSHSLYLLFHVCMDDNVSSHIGTLKAVQDAIEAVLCNIEDNKKLTLVLNEVVPLLLTRITHPVLQRHLVYNLSSTSPLTAYFQRHLALSFLLHPTVVSVPLESAEIPKLILDHLRDSPQFNVRRKADYNHLAARLTLLDIAIGPGPLTVPYQPLTSPDASQDGSSPVTAPTPLSSEERAFNREVDALAQQIKLLGNSIVETGALTDLTRLDAKDCSERLYHRLENAVRIGGKKLNNIFGQSDQVAQGQSVFSKWLSKGTSSAQIPIVSGSVEGENDEEADRISEDLAS